METIAIFIFGAALGWFASPNPAIIPPPADAMVLCSPLQTPRGPDLGSVQQSAVEAALAYKSVCRNHKQLTEWAERVTE